VKQVCLLAFFSLMAVVASASTLTIDLPLVNGVLTLSGTPGEVIVVNATITPDSPLVLGDVSISESSTEGVFVGTDTSVYLFDPSNPFYNAEADRETDTPPTSPVPLTSATTGALVTITFPDLPPFGIAEIDYSLPYGDSVSQPNQFNGFFDVDFEEAPTPEPGTSLLLAGALGICVAARRLRPRWFLRRQ
jgi:hypothetical protein